MNTEPEPEPVTDTELSSGDDTVVKRGRGRPKQAVPWEQKRTDYMREYMRGYMRDKINSMTPEEHAEFRIHRKVIEAKSRAKRGIQPRPPKDI